jgi:urea transport system ATP-binding protein
MLEIRGVGAAYGESQILWDVTLDVPPGGVLCLMGRNGVGKTTLLKTVMGLLPATTGRISFDGAELGAHSRPEDRAARGIGYVPQGREIFPNLTVGENLRVGMVSKGAPRRPRAEDAERVFELFPKLKQLLGRKGGVLSGGEQQQLAIARVLLREPKLLLLDEPTEGIQPSIVAEIAAVLQRIRAEGRRSILLVEQYLEFARSIADRFYVMDKGAVALEGDRAAFRLDEVSALLSV